MNYITQEQYEKLADVYNAVVLNRICNISFAQFVTFVVLENSLDLNRKCIDKLGLDLRKQLLEDKIDYITG